MIAALMPFNFLSRLRSFYFVLFFMLAMAVSVRAQVPATGPACNVTETLVYRIPDGVKIADTIASPDSLHVACVETKDRKYWVVVDGVRSPPYEWVAARTLTLSAEGGRFAYQVQREDLVFVEIGQAGAAWSVAEEPGNYLVGRVLFANDGSRYAYGAQKERNGKFAMILDGKVGETFDEIYSADMQFSANGKHFSFRARQGKKQLYVVDGIAHPGYDSVGSFAFGGEGSRHGYRARNAGESFMVIDGKETAHYAIAAGLVFTDDAKKYAYVIEPAGPGGKPGGNQQLVYNGGDGEKLFQPLDGIGTVGFSPDGKRTAITSFSEKKWSVVLDGKTTGTYDGTGGLLFSPDGKRLAAVAGRSKQQFLVVDGKELPPVDIVATAVFSPDSSRVAYLTVMGAQRWLMLDDRRMGAAAFFAFSPDSRYLGHAVQAGDEQWQLAIDSVGFGPKYEGFPLGARLVWESATSARTIGGRGTDMFRIKMSIGN